MMQKQTWHDYYTSGYFLAYLSNLWRSRHTYALVNNLKISSALELGAGTGLMADYFSQKLNFPVSLLEIDENLISNLKKSYPRSRIYHSDLFEFKIPEKYDLVYSIGVIEHFRKLQRRQAIEIHKRLSAKYVLIAVPVHSFIRDKFLHPLIQNHVGYEKLYKPSELIREIKTCGMKPLGQRLNMLGFTVLAEI